MKVSILGTGAYGLALSLAFHRNKCEVTLWTKIKEEYEMIKHDRCNKIVLPDYKIQDDIRITMSMEEAVKDSELIVLATPIKFADDTIKEVAKYYNKKKQIICIACKGIMQGSNEFAYDIVRKY